MVKLTKILAKPSVTMYTHIKSVVNVARYLVDKYNITFPDSSKPFKDAVTLVAAYHDIGKASSKFQEVLTTKKCSNEYIDGDVDDEVNNTQTSISYSHNMVSGALFAKYIGNDGPYRQIVSAIINHHPHNMTGARSCEDIFADNDIDEEEVESLADVMEEIVEMLNNDYAIDCSIDNSGLDRLCVCDYFSIQGKTARKQLERPATRNKLLSDQSYYLLLLAVIFKADRLCSSFTSQNLLARIVDNDTDLIDDMLSKESLCTKWQPLDKAIEILKAKGFDAERLNTQSMIAKDTSPVISVALPTGNGKTLTSLLWASSKGKIKIVSPEIAVMKSNYDEVENQLRYMNKEDIYVAAISGNEKPKDTDIVCINIDKFLNYIFENDIAINMLDILVSPVVFDEWHLMCSNVGAIATLFTNIMWIRINITQAPTLLLSATPIDAFFKFVDPTEKVKHHKSNSYKGDNIYNITTIEHNDLSSIRDYLLNHDSVVCRVNSHKQAVEINKDGSDFVYFTSRMTEEDMNSTQSFLIKEYSKEKHEDVKKSLVTTTKGEKSINYSMKGCIDFLRSAVDTIQTLGRAPRCRTNNVTEFILYHYDNPRSDMMLNSGPETLWRGWFSTINEYKGCQMTESELYELYHSYMEKYAEDIITMLKDNYANGCDILNKLTLKRKSIFEDDKAKHISQKLTLRGTNTQIFVTALDNNGEWCGPIEVSKDYLEREDDRKFISRDKTKRMKLFKERLKGEGMTNKRIERIIANLESNWEEECTWARNSKYPIPLYHYSYSSKTGLVKD